MERSNDRSRKGKGDQFPLLDERTRAKSPRDDVFAEFTLLVDPCYDDPEWYLSFNPTGRIFALEEDGTPNIFGETTIVVFNLNRRRLIRKRHTVIDDWIKKLLLIEDLEVKGLITAEVATTLRNELFAQQTAPKCAHIAVVRAIFANPVRFGLQAW